MKQKRAELNEKLYKHFDESELKGLCFSLGIDYVTIVQSEPK